MKAYVNLTQQYISSQFFENQPNKTCSHLSEKASKGRFLKPEELQNHSNEGKGQAKKKERGEEKKAMVSLLVFIMATLEKKNFWTQTVHLAVTLSKIRLDMHRQRR